MAPNKTLRTYSRGNNSSRSCIEAMNILFAKNLTERKLHNKIGKGKSKIQIKELPKKIKTALSDESSLRVNFNDNTFDKLLKVPQNNIASTKNISVKIIAKSTSTSTINHFSKVKNFSPMLSKLRSFKNKSENSAEASSYSWFKHPTTSGERITNELEIEKIARSNKKENSSKKISRQNSSRDPILLRSRVQLPEILVTETSSSKNDSDKSKSTKETSISIKKTIEPSILDPNLSYNPIFTNSVRENILVHSSTPLVSKKITRLVKQPLSPINNDIDDVDNEINTSILKSFEEISSWSEKFPSMDCQNKNNGLAKEAKGSEEQEIGDNSQQTDSFITVRGRKVNKITTGAEKDRNDPNNTRSFNLEDFELFFNKFKSRSFKLEDFEQFQNSFSQQSNNKLTQTQINKLNTISLKDFESFCTAYQNELSMHSDSFLVKSNRTINYITNRKHRLSFSKKSSNSSQKYLKLSRQFDLKNLVVVLDNILVQNSTEKLRSKSLCRTALMNSIKKKQPVVNLTRLSIKALKPTIKAKERLSLNGYRACRKFSSNYTPRRNSESFNNTLPSSDIFELGRLFINITRMPLNIEKSSPEIKEVEGDASIDKRKGRTSKKEPKNTRPSETEVKSDSASEKENKSKNRKSSNKSCDKRKFPRKNNSSAIPDDKSFDLSNHKPKESLLTSQKARKSNFPDTSGKFKLVEHEEILSQAEDTGIRMALLCKSLTSSTVIDKTSHCTKEYVAKILVGSVSDTELELKNTNHSVLREISECLRARSQEDIPRDASEIFNSSKKRESFKESSRVLRSYSNVSINSSTSKETNKYLHKPSSTDLTREVNSRISKSYMSHSNTYIAQDFSNSILLNTSDKVDSPKSHVLRNCVVNLTLHESFCMNTEPSNISMTKGSTDSTRKSKNKERNNSSSNSGKQRNSQCLNFGVSNLDTCLNGTPKHNERILTNKSVHFDHQRSAKSRNSTLSESDLIESSITSLHGDCFKAPTALNKWKHKAPNLKAGKSWRRSLLVHKRESMIDLTQDFKNASDRVTSSARQPSLMPRNLSVKRQSVKILPLCDPRLSRRKTILQTYAQSNLSVVLDDSIIDLTLTTPAKTRLTLEKSLPSISAKDIVLRRCGQTEPQPFEKLYPKSLLRDCKKIGEGVYGEVFLYTRPNGDATVMKVIPIEGDIIVNQERQKKFEEILSEIIIASELSKLRKTATNRTSAFSEVQRICCVKGKYPKILLDLWEAYDDAKGSENDHPEIFDGHQLYIVLDLANAGRDLEAFIFNNALQAVSMFKQVACALAVAEQQLQFEHRDLHWGNVLLKSVDKNKKVTCKHKGKIIESQTQGVEVTIIDFTLSRIVHDGVVIFNDLSQDPDLFVAEGDYQFEIYRLMREKNSNNWQTFEPHTNVLWLHYIVTKSITALRYKNTKTKLHKKNINCLKAYEKVILNFDSVSDFVSQYY